MAFRLFGVPVRIHFWFWLMATVIGLEQVRDAAWLAAWIAIVLQGILMHEFGHAFVGRRFGRQPNIELIALGGLTWWKENKPLSPGRSIAVSFAGPAVGIVIGLISLAVWWDVAPEKGTLVHFVLSSLVWVNLGWGLLNLLPVLPLDGGNIAASVFEMWRPGRGRLTACYLSFAVLAALIVVAGTQQLGPFILMLLLFFGFTTYQIYRNEKGMTSSATDPKSSDEVAVQGGLVRRSVPRSSSQGSVVQQTFEALERGDGARVVQLAGQLVAAAKTVFERDESFHLLAWGKLLHGDAAEAHQALRSMSGERTADPALEGAVFVELGRSGEALPFLVRAFEQGGAFVESYLLRAVQAEQAWGHVVDLASGLSKRGRPREAFRWLIQARDAGFRDGASLDADAVFADVRALPEWNEFRASLDTAP